MWSAPSCSDPRWPYGTSGEAAADRRFGRDVSNMTNIRSNDVSSADVLRSPSSQWQQAYGQEFRDARAAKGLAGWNASRLRPRTHDETPQRKQLPNGEYETPEKEELLLQARAISPREQRRSTTKPTSRLGTSPKMTPSHLPERPGTTGSARQERSRDLCTPKPTEKSSRSPRTASTAASGSQASPPSRESGHRELSTPQDRPPLIPAVRNPFRSDCHSVEDDETRNPESMWDISVIMEPLELRAFPPVEEITPSLRNALRFLAYNECPPPHWRVCAREGSPSTEEERALEAYLPAAHPTTRLTVVFDLDETLMHCQKKGIPEEQPDLSLHFTDSGTTGYVRFRPGAREVLEAINQLQVVDVVVFTASTQAYADAVLNVLDPGERLIQHRLYRQHCIHSSGAYFKDLRALGRPLSRIVLIDNSPVSLAMNPQNGIPIKSWLSDNADQELYHVLPFIQELVYRCDAVQQAIDQKYRLRDFLETLRST